MATDGVLGDGVKVAYSASSPVSWTQVTQVLNAEIPTFETERVDTTVHGTTGFKSSMPGLTEVGDLTITLLADLDELTSATHEAMFSYNVSKTTLWWAVEIPTNRAKTRYKMWEFQGNIGSVSPGAPIEDKQTLDVQVRFEGTTFNRHPAGATQL